MIYCKSTWSSTCAVNRKGIGIVGIACYSNFLRWQFHGFLYNVSNYKPVLYVPGVVVRSSPILINLFRSERSSRSFFSNLQHLQHTGAADPSVNFSTHAKYRRIFFLKSLDKKSVTLPSSHTRSNEKMQLLLSEFNM